MSFQTSDGMPAGDSIDNEGAFARSLGYNEAR
jgi:hypothetical protein